MPAERILTVNVGSSSVKLRLIDGAGAVAGSWDFPPGPPAEKLVATAGEEAFDAVGHRFVHGGPHLSETRLVTEEVRAELHRVTPLAPLHNGAALELLEQLQRALPGQPHVVCFDTAFHRSVPDEAALYPIPWEWTARLGVRRYGFHGLSHAYAARRTAELLGRPPADLRIVTCHLGSGASLAAVKGGASVDTTMGFTPNEGLMMATRSGSVGPGAVLWVLRETGLSPDAADRALEHDAGLAGVSGVSGDMREVLAAAEAGSERAALAIAAYVHRLRASIGRDGGRDGGRRCDLLHRRCGRARAPGAVRGLRRAGLPRRRARFRRERGRRRRPCDWHRDRRHRDCGRHRTRGARDGR